jgi:hypothetical protein
MDEYDFENMSEYLRTQIICNLIERNIIVPSIIPKNYFNDIICNKFISVDYHHISNIPEHLRTRELCLKVANLSYYMMQYFPDEFMEEIGLMAVNRDPFYLSLIPEHLKTEKICLEVIKKCKIRKIRKNGYYDVILHYIPEQFQKICKFYYDKSDL